MTSAYDTAATLLGHLDRQGDEGIAATVYALLAIADAIRDSSTVTGRAQAIRDLHAANYGPQGYPYCGECGNNHPCNTIRTLDERNP